jgi:hypothetical protein
MKQAILWQSRQPFADGYSLNFWRGFGLVYKPIVPNVQRYAADQALCSVMIECRAQIHEGEGNGARSRANPAAFHISIHQTNDFLYTDPQLLLPRVITCGFLIRSGIMLAVPGIMAQFFHVSTGFVLEHITWANLVEYAAIPGQPRSRTVGNFLQHLNLIFPEDVLNFFNDNARSVHIIHSTDVQLPDFLSLSPPPLAGSPDIQDAADETDARPFPDDLPDNPADIAFSEDLSFDQVLETAAACLDRTDCAGPEGLGESLDGALSAIEQTLHPIAKHDVAEFHTPPTDEHLLRILDTLTEVRRKLRLVTADRLAGRMKLARAWRLIHQQNSYIKRLEAILDAADSPPEPEPAPSPVASVDCESSPPLPPLLAECVALARLEPNQRRYTETMRKFAYAIHAISPQAYRLARVADFPLPSVTTLRTFIRTEKEVIIDALEGGPKFAQYLQTYRQTTGLTGERVPCVLAFDPAAVSATGLATKGNCPGNVFAFMLLPLDHRLPDLLVKSIRYENGRMTEEIRATKDELIQALTENGFDCFFVATDGDSGMNLCHLIAWRMYQGLGGDLRKIIPVLIQKLHQLKTWMPWPIPDLLHLLKNARARLALGQLAYSGTSTETITAASVTQNLVSQNIGETILARKPLDLLKDHLALEAFSLNNMLALWRARDVTGTYFMLPLTALNLTMRCEVLTLKTRCDLLQNALTAFSDMLEHYPSPSGRNALLQKGGRTKRKTLCTEDMCRRGCNECIGLRLALEWWGDDPEFLLALGRLASYPVECHFGTTRSTCKGDARWKEFLRAEVDAVLIRRFMRELDLRPYIRRFKSEAGCTIDPKNPGQVGVPFPDIIKRIREAGDCIAKNKTDQLFDPMKPCFMTSFFNLARALEQAGWKEKVRKSSRLSGNSITGRFFLLPDKPGVEADLASELADE